VAFRYFPSLEIQMSSWIENQKNGSKLSFITSRISWSWDLTEHLVFYCSLLFA